jgi:hypothetical protein
MIISDIELNDESKIVSLMKSLDCLVPAIEAGGIPYGCVTLSIHYVQGSQWLFTPNPARSTPPNFS